MLDSHAIAELINSDPALQPFVRCFSAGETVIRQRDARKILWLILEGELQLIKSADGRGDLRMDRLGQGELVGILSYYTGEPSFFGVEAVSDGRALALSWQQVDALEQTQAALFAFLQQRIRASITARYQRLVALHLKIEEGNHALQRERSELQQTIQTLEQTRARMVQREKLAMIGSIVPGIAHELNNPAASLARNADYLESILAAVLQADETNPMLQRCWHAGLESDYVDTVTQRQRQATLATTYPRLPRACLQRLARLPAHLLPQPADAPTRPQGWEDFLRPFEAARTVQAVRNASRRIRRLVESLRRYARPQNETMHAVDIAQGLKDTLVIMGSKLRDCEVSTEFADLPTVAAIEDELNQVWTNLIANAAEAMEGRGCLAIHCGMAAASIPQMVEIRIEDSGPGVPVEHQQSIFEPNFTTKSRGGDFGLGMGLGIAKAIIEKFGGNIRVERSRTHGGAAFVIQLPVDAEAAADCRGQQSDSTDSPALA